MTNHYVNVFVVGTFAGSFLNYSTARVGTFASSAKL
jgi:hypothetical protein